MSYKYAWFRWYHSAVRDAKLTDQPPAIRWVWPTLLTLASESSIRGFVGGEDARPDHIAKTGSLPVATVKNALKVFVERKMILVGKHGIRIKKFPNRQYDKPSDAPNAVRERVLRSRETRMKRGGNADVTRMKRDVTPHVTPQRREEKKREDNTPPTPPLGVTMVPTGFVIPEDLMTRWGVAYPAVDVPKEIRTAFEWAQANPANRKSNWQRFLVNWLKRTQDRAPRVAAEIPKRTSPYVYPAQKPEAETPPALTDEQRAENLRRVREMTATVVAQKVMTQ